MIRTRQNTREKRGDFKKDHVNGLKKKTKELGQLYAFRKGLPSTNTAGLAIVDAQTKQQTSDQGKEEKRSFRGKKGPPGTA